MARPALRIPVSTKHQKELRKLLSGGAQQVRVMLRALALPQLAKGVSAPSLLDDSPKQRIVAMVCSDPPPGRAR